MHRLLQIAEDLEAYLRLPNDTSIDDIPARLMFARMATVVMKVKQQGEILRTALTDLRCDDAAAARAVLEQWASQERANA